MAVAYVQILQLSVRQDPIDVTSGHPTANESWTYTDDQGHHHHYERGYPTLRAEVDASHWCDGTEGIALHDPHEAVDASHWECRQCGQIIEPALDPPGTPKTIPGRMDATGEGTRSDGLWVRFQITDQHALDAAVAAILAGDSEAQRAILDAVTLGTCLEIRES